MKTKPPISPKRPAAKRTAGSLRRVVRPLSKFERAQLGAALVLLTRENLDLARRVLALNDRIKLVEDLQAYIKAHSQFNNVRLTELSDGSNDKLSESGGENQKP